MSLAGSPSRPGALTATTFCTSVPRAVPGCTVPEIVIVGAAAPGFRSTSPNSQTTLIVVTTGHPPWLAVAVTPSRSTVVVNVTRTAMAAPAPERVTVWVTGCPVEAPNGVDVNTGEMRPAGEGEPATAGPASAVTTPRIGTTRSSTTPAPYPTAHNSTPAHGSAQRRARHRPAARSAPDAVAGIADRRADFHCGQSDGRSPSLQRRA